MASQTGRNDSGTDPFGPNRNELLVDLRPYDTWRAGRTKAELVDDLARRLTAEYPGRGVQLHPAHHRHGHRDRHGVVGGPRGHHQRTGPAASCARLARQTLEVLRRVPGAADTSIEQEADQAQLGIVIDRLRVARYGINVGDVQDVIDLALGGAPITACSKATAASTWSPASRPTRAPTRPPSARS